MWLYWWVQHCFTAPGDQPALTDVPQISSNPLPTLPLFCPLPALFPALRPALSAVLVPSPCLICCSSFYFLPLLNLLLYSPTLSCIPLSAALISAACLLRCCAPYPIWGSASCFLPCALCPHVLFFLVCCSLFHSLPDLVLPHLLPTACPILLLCFLLPTSPPSISPTAARISPWPLN